MKDYLNFFGTAFLTILNSVNGNPSLNFMRILDFVNCLYSFVLIAEFYHNMHFITDRRIQRFYLFSLLIYSVESIFSSLILSWESLSNSFDMDLMLAIVFMLNVNLFIIYWETKLRKLSLRFVYKLETVLQADQYMEYLALLFRRAHIKYKQLTLYSILKTHYKNCKDMRCLCFLLKFKVAHCTEKRLIDHMAKLKKDQTGSKIILYDDQESMKRIKNEHFEALE